jgi:hypothetical protein
MHTHIHEFVHTPTNVNIRRHAEIKIHSEHQVERTIMDTISDTESYNGQILCWL